jgi:hypothetical protein
MKPYNLIKLEQYPDHGDIQTEGRPTKFGHSQGRSKDIRSLMTSKHKKINRRRLKRTNKAKLLRQTKNEQY